VRHAGTVRLHRLLLGHLRQPDYAAQFVKMLNEGVKSRHANAQGFAQHCGRKADECLVATLDDFFSEIEMI